MSAEAYFNLAVVNYSAGDVERLIKAQHRECGPLLASTVNGIDLLGGMVSGFLNNNSRVRSIQVMVTYMTLPQEVAELIYSSVRCGLEHQGMPKYGINFFQLNERVDEGTILYRDDCELWLNITELARLYLDAVNFIAVNPLQHVRHVPTPSLDDVRRFNDAARHVSRSIADLCRRVDDARYDPRTMGSRSCAMPSNTLPPPLRVPPRDEGA